MVVLSDFDEDRRPVSETILHLASSGASFNANHVREARPDVSGLAVAAAFTQLAKKGAIQPDPNTPEVPSKAKNSRGRTLKWWKTA